MKRGPRILIWGIAGASLGMEAAKSLHADGRFEIYGADVSNEAYGHYDNIFESTFHLSRTDTLRDILGILSDQRVDFLLAGGDEVARQCSLFSAQIGAAGVTYIGNNDLTVELCSDKFESVKFLGQRGFKVPDTFLLSDDSLSDAHSSFPIIVKPRREGGGSRGVKMISSKRELEDLRRDVGELADTWICQEYLTDSSAELTIGALSHIDGSAAGATIMRRVFSNRLSIHDSSEGHLISSGSSQGYFFRDAKLEACAMDMAEALGSTGPLNIQCRLKKGELVPFEINPRFSASTYLRTLAGVNEIALFVNHVSTRERIAYPTARQGLALRSFTERFVSERARDF